MIHVRFLSPGTFSALVSILIVSQSTTIHTQTRESIDQNLAALYAVTGCLEGYAGAPEGERIQYPRIRSEYPQALLARTTTGTMAIAWQTVPVPAEAKANGYSFVVRAGIQSQPGIVRHFEVSVNNVPRFTITTTDKAAWAAQGKEGGSLNASWCTC